MPNQQSNLTLHLPASRPFARDFFPQELLDLILALHQQFEPKRQTLLKRRQQQLGKLPNFLPLDSEARTGNWKVHPLPADLLTRRVEITGPVNHPKMILNMLSRHEDGARADTAMLDFEDSLCPTPENIIDGHYYLGQALQLKLTVKTDQKEYRLNPKDMAHVMARVRGLHLQESMIQIDGQPISAGLFDTALILFHQRTHWQQLGQTPKLYVPKCESALEAQWWNDLFIAIEQGTKTYVEASPSFRATFLIETLPATFEIEEILFATKRYISALNVGRWDKIFSDIKVLGHLPERVFSDRSKITMTVPWMENYAKRVIRLCHRRGALAIGGMAAFTPGKEPALREQQLQKVRSDKEREFKLGHDGCWVSHPYFIAVAMSAFPVNNQKDRQLEAPLNELPSSLLLPEHHPVEISDEGLATNVRVAIAYTESWLRGVGCLAFDNLMEDLATLEISRAQVWQWLTHGHISLEQLKQCFVQEEQKITAEFGAERTKAVQQASALALKVFTQSQLYPFFNEALAAVTSTNKG